MTYSRLSSHDGGDDFHDPEGSDIDGRTPLDRTIDRIGMGTYQWTLLSLCGFGWMADNMWIQAIAIILPRVQRHFSLPDNRIGILSSSMFAGMMIGAVGWGTCSDLMGRSTAFNATLFFTSLFGIGASFATTFPMLCIALFCLGSSVGGSMPTDGTLLLEHMPRGKEYLVTALSVFFSFGAVLAALVAIVLIPKNSCQPLPAPCDLDRNLGWKYELVALGLITLTMFLARMVFFRLHESPRYLVHAGRPQDALESLQMISRFNGSELELELKDVEDRICVPPALAPSISRARLPQSQIHAAENSSIPIFNPNTGISSSPVDIKPPPVLTNDATPLSSTPPDGIEGALLIKGYSATGESEAPLVTQAALIAAAERRSFPHQHASAAGMGSFEEVLSQPKDEEIPGTEDDTEVPPPPARPRRRLSHGIRRPRTDTISSVRSSLYEVADRAWWALPRSVRRPLRAWFARFAMVFEPEWRRTTVLVWFAWWGMSLAYTMFNVYLPKLLETRAFSSSSWKSRNRNLMEAKSLERTLWDVVIFTIGGCPGAVLGAWLIEWPRLGRRLALAGSTFLTALLCVVFAMVQDPVAVTASSVGISLSATTMWAVLYGWTPEIFATKVRGTACGAASALSRVGGMIAPIAGGALLMIDPSFPVYASIIMFTLSGLCVLLLAENPGASGGKGGSRAMIH
ncbi:major facilitator superfamily domain-containing protein [Multifurca ochricompacta]|uniref:Major facilitator superfamily domain-containing protein n=1 Tax=Multifurca ochricompacta TaxID=376703 RepID=A0AAD4LU43_9AGAM|nr:major facilitator superfamily domain-containing protein [Multifurca ochricompacta]